MNAQAAALFLGVRTAGRRRRRGRGRVVVGVIVGLRGAPGVVVEREEARKTIAIVVELGCGRGSGRSSVVLLLRHRQRPSATKMQLKAFTPTKKQARKEGRMRGRRTERRPLDASILCQISKNSSSRSLIFKILINIFTF